jgi:hypothetical protein
MGAMFDVFQRDGLAYACNTSCDSSDFAIQQFCHFTNSRWHFGCQSMIDAAIYKY